MVIEPGIGIKVTCKKEIIIKAIGPQGPKEFILSWSWLCDKLVNPKKSNTKYPTKKMQMKIINEIIDLISIFFLSILLISNNITSKIVLVNYIIQ